MAHSKCINKQNRSVNEEDGQQRSRWSGGVWSIGMCCVKKNNKMINEKKDGKQLFCQWQEDGKGEGFDHSNIFQYEESDRGIHYSAGIKERIRVRMKASV